MLLHWVTGVSYFFTSFPSSFYAGIISATEQSEKEEIARLVVYESSSRPAGERISLTEYISAMPETQKDIYYLAAPSRDLAEQSPYFEALKVRVIRVGAILRGPARVLRAVATL